MSVRTVLLITTAGLFLGGGGALAYTYGFEKNELKDAFCPELGVETVYHEKNMDHYSMLIPGKEGWIFRTENDFRPDWHLNDKTSEYLLTLQEAFRMHNAALVVLMPPVRGLAHSDMLFRKDKKKYGMKDVDAAWSNYENAINELQAKGINVVGIDRNEVGDNYFYKRDHHWTAAGANVTAEKIARLVKTIPLYEQIEKADFVTTEQPPVQYESTFEKPFRKICGTKIPPETATHYITASAKPIQSEGDLFGDNENPPQVVLLGTSNSLNDSSQANFEGFLKDYLSADLLNVSYVGAGIDTGIMSYINSDHFKNRQPKIVIWEVPGYYDLNIMDDKLFNQIIPAAMGTCHAPVYQDAVNALPDGSSVLLDTQKIGASGLQPASLSSAAPVEIDHEMYMHLSFSQPVKDKFSIAFSYENGGTKFQNFERSERYPHDGDFYTLLPVFKSKLKNISIVRPAGSKPVDVSVQICRLPETTPEKI